MKKTMLCAIAILASCAFAGCGQGAGDAETEALRRQVADLQSQVEELQQNSASGEDTGVPAENAPDDTDAVTQAESLPADDAAPANPPADNSNQSDTASSQADSALSSEDGDTMASLETLVDDYASRADALLDGGSNPDLDEYFAYKQESEEIDRRLDRYDNDLERQVRDGSLSRDDYHKAERQLDLLEESLDHAEESLEYYFGIDD